MNRLWRAYVLSNIHIAFCAVIFSWAGYCLLEVSTNIWVLIFLFTGSLCTYTLHRIISGGKLTTLHIGHQRFSFVRKIGKWKIAYLSFLILISLFSFSMLSQYLRFYLAGLSFLSIGYIIPLLGSEKRLRDVNMLKIFLVAIVWAGIFLIPIFEMKTMSFRFEYTLLFLEKFIFFFALTLPFDIRDREIDQETDVSTFANVLTIKQMKFLIVGLILLCCTLTIGLYLYNIYSNLAMISLLTFYSIQTLLSLRINLDTKELYYLGILDGLILIQGLIIIIGD